MIKRVVSFSMAFMAGCLLLIPTPSKLYAQFEEIGLSAKFEDGRFLVYASDQASAQTVGTNMRALYEKVISDIGYSGGYTTHYRILIWKKREGYVEFLRSIGAKASLSSVAVAIADFQDLPTIAGYWCDDLLKATLPHEITHLIIKDLLKVNDQDIPLWIHEGLAMYESAVDKKQAIAYLKKALGEATHIPLKDLIFLEDYPSAESKMDIFYLEAYSLVDYLLSTRRKKEDFFSFLRWHVVKGYSFEKAYLYAYGAACDLNDFEKKWWDSVKQ